VFAEPFDEMIALANVETTGAETLEDVDEVHETKSGRDDPDIRRDDLPDTRPWSGLGTLYSEPSPSAASSLRFRNQPSNAIRALLGFDLTLTPQCGDARRANLIIRHLPRPASAGRRAGTPLVFAEPFDEMIALTDVEPTGADALEDVDEVHEMKSGRDDWI
jgi:hypothetical protein